MKKLLVLISAGMFVFVFAVAGCNTMEGVGKDLKKGGESIEKAAKK